MMERRPFDFARDIEVMVELQRLSFEINFPGEAFSESWFRDEMRRVSHDEQVWVYEEAQELVGCLWLDLGRKRSTVHIRHIQVAEAWWGRGLGRSILRDAIVLGRAAGRKQLTLNVTKSNARAMSLYAHLGFQVELDYGARQFMSLDLQDSQCLSG